MNHKRVIFITGVTGYLGCHLAYRFLKDGHQLIALTRESSKDLSAAQRTFQQIAQVGQLEDVHITNLITIPGDITETPGTWIEKIREKTNAQVDEVWHCATTFKIKKREKEEVKAINIEGTKNMLEFVIKINPKGPPRYFHISTAYSNGRGQGPNPEEIKKDNLDFRSLYEWSKHEGEFLAESYQEKYNLDVSILRPSILIGSKETKVFNTSGYYDFFKSLYTLRRGFEINRGDDFDGNIDTRVIAVGEYVLNVIPINIAVEAMLLLANEPKLETKRLKVFNIVNEAPPTMNLIHEILCESLNISGFTMVSKDVFNEDPMTPLERFFKRKIAFHGPYISENAHIHSNQKFRKVITREKLPNPTIDETFFRDVNRVFIEELEHRLKEGEIE